MWAWIAFEKLVDVVCPPLSGRGPTNKAIDFLKEYETSSNLIGIKAICRCASTLAKPDVVRNAERSAKKTNSLPFIHVHLCREARNDFVHSHGVELYPSDWGEHSQYQASNDEVVVLLRQVSRLTLLTIQSLLFVYFRDSTAKTGEFMCSLGIKTGLRLPEAVRILHLTDGTTEDDQYSFNFGL